MKHPADPERRQVPLPQDHLGACRFANADDQRPRRAPDAARAGVGGLTAVRTARWHGALLLAAVCCAGLTSACRRETVQVYEVEKAEQVAASDSGHREVGLPGDSTKSPALKYRLPAGWVETEPQAMRAAAFRIGGPDGQTAEVAVVPLRSLAGRELELVNMWRAQVGLEALEDRVEPDQLGTKVRIGLAEGRLFDVAGPAQPEARPLPRRILAAVLERDGTSWVFKMTGPRPLVAAQHPAFLEFLESVEFLDAAPARAASEPKRRRRKVRRTETYGRRATARDGHAPKPAAQTGGPDRTPKSAFPGQLGARSQEPAGIRCEPLPKARRQELRPA